MKRYVSTGFYEYIRQFSVDTLFSLLGDWITRERKIVSSSRLKQLVQEFSGSTHLQTRFDNLGEDEKVVCSGAYLFGACGIMSPQDSRVRTNLLRSLLCFPQRDEERDTMYWCGFDELEPALRSRCAHTLAAHCATRYHSFSEADCIQGVSPCYYNDIVALVALCTYGCIKFTKDGELTKRSREAVHALRIGEGLLAHSESGEDAPIPIFDYCISRGLIRNVQKEAREVPARMQRWLEWSDVQKRNDMVTFLCGSPPRMELLEEIADHAGDTLLSTEALDSRVTGGVGSLMRVYVYTGFIEARPVAHTHEYLFYVPTPSSHTETSQSQSSQVTVMPDYSAIIARDIAPHTLHAFSMAGKLEEFDTVYKARIDKQTVFESLARGVEPDVLLDYLHRWQVTNNIIACVRDWIDSFFRIHVARGSFLCSLRDEVSAQIDNTQQLQQHLDVVPAHRVYRIRQGHEEYVLSLLQNMGFDTRAAGVCRDHGPGQGDNTSEMLTGGSRVDSRRPVNLFAYGISSKGHETETSSHDIKGGKYSCALKPLEATEMFQVIDYARVMRYRLLIEYCPQDCAGSKVYEVEPIDVRRGSSPALSARKFEDGTIQKEKEEFLIQYIERIGVKADD